MKKVDYNIEGIGITVEVEEHDAKNQEHRLQAYMIKSIREYSGMERKEFCDWLGIPYRTLQDWELGNRVMHDYVLRLIAYKVRMEKTAGRI